jgi:hypothetical protein
MKDFHGNSSKYLCPPLIYLYCEKLLETQHSVLGKQWHTKKSAVKIRHFKLQESRTIKIESGINRKAFIKWRGAEIFSKICPSSKYRGASLFFYWQLWKQLLTAEKKSPHRRDVLWASSIGGEHLLRLFLLMTMTEMTIKRSSLRHWE